MSHYPVYLDNAATSRPKPAAVYERMDQFMREVGVSTGRGAYRLAHRADALVYRTRSLAARLLGVSRPERVIFTPGVTFSLNMVIRGLVGPGDRVVTTGVEHNAVWRPLVRSGATVQQVMPGPDGVVPADAMIAEITDDTKLVAMTHASNVTGAIQPVKEAARRCGDLGIPLVIDAAQTGGCLPVDGLEHCLLALAGHKGLLGPPGIGVLYIPPGLDLEPLVVGGTGEESRSDAAPATLPERYEAGTLNVPGIVGLGAGIDYILTRTVADIRRHEQRLIARALDGLLLPGVSLFGPCDPARQTGVLSFSITGLMPGDVSTRLDEDYGIMTRSGLHCSPCCHRTIGTIDRGTVRIGVGPFTTDQDIDRLVEAVSSLAPPGGRS